MSAILTELELGVRYTWGGLDKQVIKRSHVFAANLIRKAVHYGEGDVVKFGIWTERQPAGTYSSYGRLPRVRRKAVKRGTIGWKHYASAVQIDGPTLRGNIDVGIGALLRQDSLKSLGRNKANTLFSFIDEQMEEAISSLVFEIGTDIYGTGDGADGETLQGQKTIIDTTASYAGLAVGDVGTDDVDGLNRWSGHVDTNSGTNRSIGLEDVSAMLANLRRGTGEDDPEDIMVYMNNKVFNTFNLLLEGQHPQTDENLARLGFKNVVYDFATFVRDEMAPANQMIFINHNSFWLGIRNSADFDFLGFQQEDDSVVGHVISDLALICSDRHRQGRIEDISTI